MKKRGIGVACMQYPLGFTSYPNPSAAFVKINEDGTATVLTGATDIGQGSTTVLGQIAAEELGISRDQISMVTSDTDRTPLDMGSIASRVTYIAGNAVKKAAADAKKILFEEAAYELNVDVRALESANGKIFLKDFPDRSVSFADMAEKCTLKRGKPPLGKGSHNPATTHLDAETGRGKPFEAYVYAAQVAKVEVDTETGEVEVLKIYAAHDCGNAINPRMVEGQIIGGVSMGVGYALTEEVVLKDGWVQNPQLRDYIIPTAMDMPEVETAIIQDPEPTGPFGAKGIGEPSLLPTAPAIINAIYDAVGVRIKELPATPEKILRGIKELEKNKQ